MQNSQENLLELPKKEEEKLLLVTQIYLCLSPLKHFSIPGVWEGTV